MILQGSAAAHTEGENVKSPIKLESSLDDLAEVPRQSHSGSPDPKP